MTTQKAEIVVLATAKARPGKEAELERALRDVAAPTRAQRGCLNFELLRSVLDPATITALERWASEEDHQQHLQGDHVKKLIVQFGEILAAAPEIISMKPL